MIVAARTRERGPVSVRRAGYGVAVIVNAALAFLVNAWPGWEAVPFLTEDTPQVLPLVNLSLAAGVIANIVYLANDAPWVKAVGDLVTNGIGLVVLVQVWRVFPFEFSSGPFDWQILVRVPACARNRRNRHRAGGPVRDSGASARRPRGASVNLRRTSSVQADPDLNTGPRTLVPAQQKLIELAGVEKVYRMGKVDYRALRGVDLSLAAESWWRWSGPRGAENRRS